MASVLVGKSVPMLPWPLDIMNEAECIKYLLPEIKKDIAENTGRTVSRIHWGSEKDHPACWPDDLVPWQSVTNPNHVQETNFGIMFVLVLQEAISRRLRLKGFDPVYHIQEFDLKTAERRRHVRKKVKYDITLLQSLNPKLYNENEKMNDIHKI